jgi:quinol monooxygenase YgiN
MLASSIESEGGAMHARVTTLSGSPGDVDAGIANFRDNVVPYTKSDGKGAILLVDRGSGTAVAITLWEDEAAMQASEESANALRADAAEQMGASEPTVDRYEVAVFEV